MTERNGRDGERTWLRGVTHDLYNALTAVRGGLELMADAGPPTPEDHQDTVAAVEYALELALELRHGLDERAAPRTAPRALGPLIERTVRRFSRLRPGIVGRTRLEPDLWCDTDALAFVRALSNVLENAAEAMGDRGRLEVVGRRCGGRVEIEVHDFGPGLTADAAARCFEAGFSTKGAGGRGLGLAIVRGYAVGSGGGVRVHSTPGEGATIRIWLPEATRCAAAG